MKKLVLVLGLIVLILVLMVIGTAYAKSWAAERRENLTREQIIKNLAVEIEKEREGYASVMEANAILSEQKQEVIVQVKEIEVLEECEVPEELSALLQ